MALINCAECGKEISDKATSCPACGAPVTKAESKRPPAWDVVQEPKKKESVLGIWGMILSLICCLPIFPFVGIILCIIALRNKNKKTTCAKLGIVFAIISFIIGFAAWGSSDKEEVSTNQSTDAIVNIESTEAPTPTPTEVPIEYIQCTVDELIDILDTNALKAEKTYQDQYLEVTGRLAVIDSDGDYISLHPINNKWAFQGIQCSIENEEQLNHVLDLSVDDTVTVRVQCKSIGEVLGYSADIIEFVK